jgi:hypothetical protein
MNDFAATKNPLLLEALAFADITVGLGLIWSNINRIQDLPPADIPAATDRTFKKLSEVTAVTIKRVKMFHYPTEQLADLVGQEYREVTLRARRPNPLIVMVMAAAMLDRFIRGYKESLVLDFGELSKHMAAMQSSAYIHTLKVMKELQSIGGEGCFDELRDDSQGLLIINAVVDMGPVDSFVEFPIGIEVADMLQVLHEE